MTLRSNNQQGTTNWGNAGLVGEQIGVDVGEGGWGNPCAGVGRATFVCVELRRGLGLRLFRFLRRHLREGWEGGEGSEDDGKKKAMEYAPLDAAVDRTAVTHHRHATCAGRARQRGEQVHILRGQGGGVIGRPLIFC